MNGVTVNYLASKTLNHLKVFISQVFMMSFWYIIKYVILSIRADISPPTNVYPLNEVMPQNDCFRQDSQVHLVVMNN